MSEDSEFTSFSAASTCWVSSVSTRKFVFLLVRLHSHRHCLLRCRRCDPERGRYSRFQLPHSGFPDLKFGNKIQHWDCPHHKTRRNLIDDILRSERTGHLRSAVPPFEYLVFPNYMKISSKQFAVQVVGRCHLRVTLGYTSVESHEEMLSHFCWVATAPIQFAMLSKNCRTWDLRSWGTHRKVLTA